MKHLARLADERWASKRSYLDKPQEQQPGPATETHDATYHAANKATKEPVGVHNAVGTEAELDAKGGGKKKKEKEKSPWDRAPGGAPSENWQPDSWDPNASKK